MLIFSEHNVLCNPPFSRLDLITCRNLFIYLKQMCIRDRFYMTASGLSYEQQLEIGKQYLVTMLKSKERKHT